MPKITSREKVCKRCNLSHPETWFRIYTLKDGSKKRTDHCKLCVDPKDGMDLGTETVSSIDSWQSEVFSKMRTPQKSLSQPSYPKTIRFRYTGPEYDLWLVLRKSLTTQEPSSIKDKFMKKWATNANLVYDNPHNTKLYDKKHPTKNVFISDTFDPNDSNDIIINNINSGDTYKEEWTSEQLKSLSDSFKDSIHFKGLVEAVIEIHI